MLNSKEYRVVTNDRVFKLQKRSVGGGNFFGAPMDYWADVQTYTDKEHAIEERDYQNLVWEVVE